MRRVKWAISLPILLAVGPTLSAAGGAEPGVPLLLSVVEEWNIDEVRVESRSFSVDYRGGNSFLRGEVYGPPGAQVSVTREAETLVIRVEEPAPLRMDASGAIRIHGPDDVELTVNSAHGAVRITDLTESEITVDAQTATTVVERVTGSVTVQSGDGMVRMRDFDGEAVVRNRLGDVRLELSSGSFDFQSANGSIRLFSARGAFQLHTGAGSIIGSAISIRGDSNISTGSGSVDMDVDSPRRELHYHLTSESGTLYLLELKAMNVLDFGSGETQILASSESGDIRFY